MSQESTYKECLYIDCFDIINSKIVVSDPGCVFDLEKYNTDVWKLNTLMPNVKNGKWHAWIDRVITQPNNIDRRNSALYVLHNDIATHFFEKKNNNDWHDVSTIDVDTGQVCICDINYYDNKNMDDIIDKPWYDMVCNITADRFYRAGTISHGVASSSGYGDGSYKLYELKSDNQTIGLKIIFIDDYDSMNDVQLESTANDFVNENGKVLTGGQDYLKKYNKYKKKYFKLKKNHANLNKKKPDYTK